MKRRPFLLTFLLLAFHIFHAALANEDNYYNQHAKGWHWYDDPVQSEDENKENHSVVSDPIEQMSIVQQTVKRALDKAILEPTDANVKNYLSLQNQWMEQSSRFSNMWKKVLLEDPQLDYSLVHPTNNMARQIESDEDNRKEEVAIQELAKSSGLFFFYRSSCPYCVRFAPIVKAFAERYRITVIPITTDGIALPEFPHSYPDQGQSKTFHVTMEPALFAVNPYTQKAYPIGFGLMSEADLKKRILDIATRFRTESA